MWAGAGAGGGGGEYVCVGERVGVNACLYEFGGCGCFWQNS